MKCPECNGTGEVPVAFAEQTATTEPCDVCKGTGIVNDLKERALCALEDAERAAVEDRLKQGATMMADFERRWGVRPYYGQGNEVRVKTGDDIFAFRYVGYWYGMGICPHCGNERRSQTLYSMESMGRFFRGDFWEPCGCKPSPTPPDLLALRNLTLAIDRLTAQLKR